MTKSDLRLPTSPKGLIETPESLAEVCTHLRAAGRFGFDTEFIGETSYRPILCLIQVSTDERVELIDPMTLKDLAPFWELLADPAIEKICHAGDQDLAIAWQLGRVASKNVFDCQIGGGFVGFGYPVAYWRLVEECSGVALEKAHTFSAWDRRPLTRSQFTYAVDDVAYLPTIHRMLRDQMAALNHTHWMREACDELCIKASTDSDPRLAFGRIKSAGSLDPVQLSVLRELALLREQISYEHDVPARSMFKDEALLDIAQRMPEELPRLLAIRSVPKEEVATYGGELLAAIKRGKALPAEQRPYLPPPIDDSMEVKRLAEMMYAASQVICLGQSVSPSLVTSQAEILALARRMHAQKDLAKHPLMSGWARECLGEPLTKFARGETKLGLRMTIERMHLDTQ